MRALYAGACAVVMVAAGAQVVAGQEVLWEARPGFRDSGPMVAANGVVLTGNITGRGATFAFDAATGTHRVNRELPYVNEWTTSHFHVAANGIYYENESILVKVRPVPRR